MQRENLGRYRTSQGHDNRVRILRIERDFRPFGKNPFFPDDSIFDSLALRASRGQLEYLNVVNENLVRPDRDVNVVLGSGLMVFNAAP
jgi:hypothetical protein